MKRLLASILLTLIFANSMEASEEDYRYLDAIALDSGADKGSNYHNYTEVYSKYFAPFIDKPIKFLEIGIYRGASAKMWEKYFKKAELHFMDITFDAVEYQSDRSHYHLCNQENTQDLASLIKSTGGNFDVILDDGGHMMTQQITSFVTLFPHIKSGGMYIIEDLHTSYWPAFGGGGVHSTVNFLKSLIDDVNFVGATTTRASHQNLPYSTVKQLNIYRKEIESIHFYDSVAIIFKR